MTEATKFCPDCKIEKNLSEFTPTKNDPTKYRPECNECSPARLERVKEGIRSKSSSASITRGRAWSDDIVELPANEKFPTNGKPWSDDIVELPANEKLPKIASQDAQTIFKLMKNDHALEIQALKKDHAIELMKLKIDIIEIYERRVQKLTDKLLSMHNPVPGVNDS